MARPLRLESRCVAILYRRVQLRGIARDACGQRALQRRCNEGQMRVGCVATRAAWGNVVFSLSWNAVLTGSTLVDEGTG
jgi:hypothetical protein